MTQVTHEESSDAGVGGDDVWYWPDMVTSDS